jgi:predicted transcriptional regulator
MTRRPDGALETDVLRALWDLDAPASPADVIEEMQTDLAYTSIATILGRLCDKGQVSRRRLGRSYLYSAVSTEADLTSERIRSVLATAGDRHTALAGFLNALDPADIAVLTDLLNDD